jgi:acyl transferase domain-containing protein/acyl carrier protein
MSVATLEESGASADRIAVIGLAGRFPGAADVAAFWRNLCAGVESIRFFSREELRAAGVPPKVLDDPNYVRANGALDGADLFDADFFGMTPREAESLDPQHRLFLECAWTALEQAGYDPETVSGRIGVYAGAGASSYLVANLLGNPEFLASMSDLQLLMGNNKDFLPTRVSYKLNLKGPSFNVSSACSTSLVAIHLACQGLLDYHCDLALAGGAGIQLPQDQGYLYTEGGVASPDGHCRAFDARAGGTVNGNGVGAVLLRRLEDALAAGDTIYAVIAGSAVNNDGAAKVGYTAPSVSGQAAVIAEALALAGFPPDTVGYVETHGTGTALGDPIEIEALTQAFRSGGTQGGRCALGSVKTNLGHLDEAAGIAGFIKAVLAVRHGMIPPSLHFERPNPRIDFAAGPFFVNAELRPWPAGAQPRRAGVSSFGIGGTNAHVVLEQAPPEPESAPSRPDQLLVWSARTPAALATLTADLAAYFSKPEAALADVAYTLQAGRRAFPERRALVCRSPEEAAAALAAGTFLEGRAGDGRSVAFLFSGQGSQYAGMGRTLYADQPVFRETVDRSAELLRPHLGLDLREALYPADSAAASLLDRTALAQPALFVTEYALARLWLSFGIRPAALLGHSLGEYVAACLAGVFSLEDALALVAARGALMQSLPAGAMLALRLPEAETLALLAAEPALSLAAVNGPESSVVSGPPDAVAAFAEKLAERGLQGVPLKVSHAFHSAMMEPMLPDFRARFENIRLGAPTLPYLSNLTGTWIRPEEATDPAYWVAHLRRTVRFDSGLEELLRDPARILLEVGPGRVLADLARRHPARGAARTVLASLPAPRDGAADGAVLLDSLGRLWLAGLKVDWSGLQPQPRRRVPLPTYPFERKRYWVEPAPSGEAPAADPVADWFYRPVWKPAPPAEVPRSPRDWLLFLDDGGLGDRLAERLRADGRAVVAVRRGTRFVRHDDRSYSLRPAEREDYQALLRELAAAGRAPGAVVHLWCADAPADSGEALERGFHSLVCLAQALGGTERPVAIGVVSRSMQAVGAAETTIPEFAALLGPVQVIAREYPQLRCRSIDLEEGPATPGLAERLVADVLADSVPAILAYRGNDRLARDFEPLRWPAPAFPSRLRRGGVYLITGALGSMGLAFAEYLARTAEARLVLTARTVPPEDGSDGTATLAEDLEASLVNPGLDAFPGAEARLNAYCSALVLEYLAARGVELIPGRRYPREHLETALALLPPFARMLDCLLAMLAEDGIVARRGDDIEVLARRPPPPASVLKAELLARHPEFKGLVELVDHCVSRYPDALSREGEAVAVLFPEGSPELLDRSGRDTADYAHDRLYLEQAARLTAELAKARGKLRILEVGGGTGALTHHMLEALAGSAVEYHFTDLGPSFVARAEAEARRRGLDFVRFGVLDITRDPAPQGYAADSFDVVLAYNVVHATPRIPETLATLRGLLKPGGLLLLVEIVRPLRWNDLIWGLTPGWWHFEDQRTTSPLLEPDRWETLLRKQGYAGVAAYPRNAAERGRAINALLVARRPDAADPRRRAALQRLRALEAAGSELLLIEADVTDRAAMQAAVEQAVARFGAVHGAFHTAGVLGQGLIHAKARAETEAVLAPKVLGSQVLADAIRPLNPDFLVLCSSLSSVAPIVGQVDYSAANAFLDAFAVRQTRLGLPAVSVDWGFWQELGMIEAAHIPEQAKQALALELDRDGLRGAGVDILGRVLDRDGFPQVAVSPTDFRAPARSAVPAEIAGERPESGAGEERPLPPLFDARSAEASGPVVYVTRLDPRRHWLVDEHRLAGTATLPGTAYLELVRAAFAHHRGATAVELRNVYFLTPLSLPGDREREVRTVLQGRGEGADFTVASRIGEDRWLEHARGEIGPLPAEPLPVHDVRALAAALGTDEREPDGPVSAFGPHWNNVRTVRFGAGAGLARLELPAPYAGETEDYALHPALLDMATGFMTLREGLPKALPFSYGRFVVREALPARIYSHIRIADQRPGTLSFEVRLLDEHGRELASAEDYVLREAAAHTDQAGDSRNLCLEIAVPGALHTLGLKTLPRRRPGPGEVEIRVRAAGLNFIEVLYALGMLPKSERFGPVRFGIECAGEITAVGAGVTDYRPGDEVVAYTGGCFGLYTVAEARAVARKPAGLSFEQAATLPAAYTTAYYSLVTLGRLKAGERVLIHAAAGGLGLAAVRIARQLGADVIATAGSEEKRAYLRSLGVRHVFDSRSLSFAPAVLEATGGRGVDAVLNSLGGEFLARSLELLAPYGRFLEVGKRDLLKNARLDLQPFLKSLAFFVIDVGPSMPGFDEVWREVAAQAAAGIFTPLPCRAFSLADAAEAFEYMAAARHIGKVVLTVADGEDLWSRAAAREQAGVPFADLIGGGPSAEAAAAPSAAETPSRRRSESDAGPNPPRTATETAVADIWRQLLGVEAIGRDDNFFELRGDSLLAAQVTSRIHRRLGVRLPLSSLFDDPTVAGLAARIDRLREPERDAAGGPATDREEGTI